MLKHASLNCKSAPPPPPPQPGEVKITSSQMPDPGGWALMELIDALDRKMSVSIELKRIIDSKHCRR